MQLATTALIVLNVVVFLLMFKENPGALWKPSAELLMRAGADYGPLVANGQWWRCLTSGFVHVGVLHLLLNMSVLSNVGKLESTMGALKYLLIYFVSMISASFLSLYFHPYIVSAGASGAIFGLLGSQLVILAQLWKKMPKKELIGSLLSYALMLGLYIGIGACIPQIDNFAHIGGLLGGIVASVALLPLDGKKKIPNIVNLIALGAIAGLIWSGYSFVVQRDKDATDAMTAEQLVQIKREVKDYAVPFWMPSRIGSPVEAIGSACLECPDYKTAIEMADKEVDLDKQNGHAYYTRAMVQHKFNHDSEALVDVDKALALVPRDYDFVVLKARIELVLKHIEAAESDVHAAMKCEHKEHAEAEDVAGCCQLAQGDPKGASNHFSKAISENAELGSAYYHRAMVHQMLGDKFKAQQDFVRAQDHSYIPNQWDKEHAHNRYNRQK